MSYAEEPYPTLNGVLPETMRLNEVHFLGSHNSAMSKEHKWRYYQQDVSIKKQWKQYGVRAFKIPLHYFIPSNTKRNTIKKIFNKGYKGDSYIVLAHEPNGGTNAKLTRLQREANAYPEPAEAFFSQLANLLEEDKNEIAIVMIESYLSVKTKENGMIDDPRPQHQMLQEILQNSGAAKYVYSLKENAYGNQTWPTLGEMRSKNQRLILISSRREDNLDHVSLYRENAFVITLENLQKSNFEGMRSEGRSHNSQFLLMNHFAEVSIPKGEKIANFLKIIPNKWIQKASNGRELVTDYNYFNSYDLIKKHIKLLRNHENVAPPNILLIDFVNKGDNGGAQRIIFELNALSMNRFLQQK